MNAESATLEVAPIVEAVLDIDCALPPGFALEQAEPAVRERFGSAYPEIRAHRLLEHQFTFDGQDTATLSARELLNAWHCYSTDEKSLVQLRRAGFSFNRFAPYQSMDDYLPAMAEAWAAYVALVQPVLVTKFGLHYINRLEVPLEDGRPNLASYLLNPPTSIDSGLMMDGFLHQQTGVDRLSGDRVNTLLTLQPVSEHTIALIVNIEAMFQCQIPVPDWATIDAVIARLRALKNRVFINTLKPSCLSLPSPSA